MKKEDIKALTLPEYFKFLEEFFTGQVYQGQIVKLITRGGDWTYLVPAGVHDTDFYIKTWWETDEFLQSQIPSVDEILKKVDRTYFTEDSGKMIRCLFRKDEVVYQPLVVPLDNKGLKKFIKDRKQSSEKEILLGFRMDPYSFVAKFKIENGRWIDQGRNDPEVKKYNLDENNYRVFYTVLSKDKFLEEEKRYLEHAKTGSYSDDFITSDLEFTEPWEEFLKENTDL